MNILDVDGDGRVDILASKHWIKHTGGNTHMPNEIDPGYPVERARIAGGQFIPGCFAEVVISWGDGEGR